MCMLEKIRKLRRLKVKFVSKNIKIYKIGEKKCIIIGKN